MARHPAARTASPVGTPARGRRRSRRHYPGHPGCGHLRSEQRGQDPDDPGLSDPDRPGHPAPALSHLPPHRLRPARHHGHQLRLHPHAPGHWRRIRPAHHTGRGDRGRHRCHRLRGAGQVDPPPVPSPGHRHGDLHHRPVPLSHRCKVHGRRCRLRVVRQRQELGGGPYHPGCGGLPQPLHQGHHQAGLHPHWHTGRLCHCLFPGHRGSVRGGQRGLGRPAQAHAL